MVIAATTTGITIIPRNDQTSQVFSQCQPRTRFMGVAKLPFIPPASNTSSKAAIISGLNAFR